mgnify:CR=1 FL=1
MIGIAKVKIELSNGGQRLFKFIVKGEGSEDIESEVERFAKTTKRIVGGDSKGGAAAPYSIVFPRFYFVVR